VWAVGDVRTTLGERDATDECEIRLLPAEGDRFSPGLGPDRVVAGTVHEGRFEALGEVDGRYLSTEVAGGMTGRMVGAWCAGGEVFIRSFAYAGADDPGALDPA
jgi:xylan 1,4-beta-xylosidase